MSDSKVFRKRGGKTVTVFAGAESEPPKDERAEKASHGGSGASANTNIDDIKKGMTVGEVERILGQGEGDPGGNDGKYAVVNYRRQGGGIAVVYRDQRVISRVSTGS